MITNKSTYSELKEFFTNEKGEVRSDLPETLDGETKYYASVKSTLQNWIDQGDYFLKHGNQKQTAKQAKTNMFLLYSDLKNKEGWDKPMERLSDKVKNKKL